MLSDCILLIKRRVRSAKALNYRFAYLKVKLPQYRGNNTLTLHPESKDATCVCILCEHAKLIVMGPVILQPTWISWQNSLIPSIPGGVAIPKCLNSCCHEGLMGLACVHLHLTFTHVNYVLFPIKALLMWASMKHDHFS